MPEEQDRLESLDERVYRDIRSMIVAGQLRPGEQIVQEALAERLGVSRTPIRKAIAALEQENFLEISGRGSVYVRSFAQDELISIWEIRAVLEGLVCRLAARRAEAKHVAYLRSLIRSAADQVTADDWSAYRAADKEFHGYLAELVNDPMVTRILDSYQILSITLAQGLLRPPDETLPEHLEILDALEAGEPDRAEQAMLYHIRTSIAHLEASARLVSLRSLEDVEEELQEMADRLDETVLLIVRDGDAAEVVQAAEGTQALRVFIPQNTRWPITEGALGRVLRGEEDGAHIEVDEPVPGAVSVTAPVSLGELTQGAAMVVVPNARWDDALRDRILGELATLANN